MPGQLRKDAKCPVCDRELVCLVDTTNWEKVEREYFHVNDSQPWQKCKRTFTNRDEARNERTMLEVVAGGTVRQ